MQKVISPQSKLLAFALVLLCALKPQAARAVVDQSSNAMAVDAPDTARALRAEMEGMWGGVPPAPDKFIDLSYCERALRQAR